MKGSAPRYAAPLDVPRPRGARLIEAFSPKLSRRVCLFDQADFAQWIRLEADPAVLSLCERPSRLDASRGGRLIDFWVQRREREELLVLAHGNADSAVPGQMDGVPLRAVSAAERAAANTWISNWRRMLPVINATRTVLPKGLSRSVLDFVREPVALSRIEQQFSAGDPPLVRGTVFDLLRTGHLCAPALHIEPLTLHTLLEPSP